MKLWILRLRSRWIYWSVMRRHERHIRWLRKARVAREALERPHHSAKRNGTQAVP